MQHINLYLSIFISLGLGILAGWFLAKKSQTEGESNIYGRNAYIRGLKYIISNQPDKAIAEFTRAVQINSNTIEIYQDLGNLFRERGEVGRAIQIHQSILLRPSLDRKLRISALMDLGLDFQKGGFIDRAIKIYQEVIQADPNNIQARKYLEKLYEKEKNWDAAYQEEKQIQKLSGGEENHSRLAHLMTEMGKAAAQANDHAQAVKHLKEAINLDKNCTEAYLALGDMYLTMDKPSKAISTFEQIVFSNRRFPLTVYKYLEKAYLQKGRYGRIESIYQEIIKLHPQDVSARIILADYYYKKGSLNLAIKELQEGLKLYPESLNLHAALAEMFVREDRQEEALQEFQQLVKQMKERDSFFYCQKCGYQSSDMQWKCPQCQEWDSFVINEA
jgi:lipopolysaccharide biosynthesis regulator YciM